MEILFALRKKIETESPTARFAVARPSLHNLHFINQVGGASKFVYDKQRVADVEDNASALRVVINNIVCGAFPVAIEVHANEISAGVNKRASRISARGVL